MNGLRSVVVSAQVGSFVQEIVGGVSDPDAASRSHERLWR
ncbi:hypothetical protein PLANPX_5929 [Lacipirellula parvula]|uniref:Uncharacterized protein n=1 Tax=Lacipirellula parvula TaxID=2650471 RepID=A0A5K7XJM0_9BACT|nr:hypothetical protein PLANPX_5929 [Lacipirellula parvula]